MKHTFKLTKILRHSPPVLSRSSNLLIPQVGMLSGGNNKDNNKKNNELENKKYSREEKNKFKC